MVKKLIPVIAVVVLLGGGFFAYKTFLSGGGGPKLSPAAAHKKELKAAEAEMKKRKQDRVEGQTVSLGDDFIVNLADAGLAHFAKFQVTLKVDAGTPVAAGGEGGEGPALEDTPQIRDIVIADASAFTADELASTEGKERLKRRIAVDVSNHTETLPLEIFFTTFAIQ